MELSAKFFLQLRTIAISAVGPRCKGWKYTKISLEREMYLVFLWDDCGHREALVLLRLGVRLT